MLVQGRVDQQGTDEQLSADVYGTYSQLLRAAGLGTKFKTDIYDSQNNTGKI